MIADWQIREMAHRIVRESDVVHSESTAVATEQVFAELKRKQWYHAINTTRKSLLGTNEDNPISLRSLIFSVANEIDEGPSVIKGAMDYLQGEEEAVYKFGRGVWATSRLQDVEPDTAYYVPPKGSNYSAK